MVARAVRIRALTWNLYHGRDAPPDPALHTLRSRLLGATERGSTHVQVNRDLRPEFTRLIAAAEWDVALLQECPPRWAEGLAEASGADAHLSLTSRNWLSRPRAALARRKPDLLGSWEGGSNLTLVRGEANLGREPAISERRELVLRRLPERRTMTFTRLAIGVCVANLHASNRFGLAAEEVRIAAAVTTRWADGAPLLLGGDLNLRPRASPAPFAELRERFGLAPPTAPEAIDHLLASGLEVVDDPRAWAPEARELGEDGLRLRLSDHAPVAATFAKT